MKIAPSSEAYCEKNDIVMLNETVESKECQCCKCIHLVIRAKKKDNQEEFI